MTSAAQPDPGKPAGSISTDRLATALPALGLVALCVVLYGWRLGLTPLEDFDEAYYAVGAREMLQRGDLGTPFFNGQPFLLKPILIYWLIAAAFQVLGQSEFAARLPSAFLGTVVVALTWWFGCRTVGARAGLLSGMALALCPMWVDIARDASIDVPLTAALTGALFLVSRATRAPHRARGHLHLAVYPLLGLALLAKGPVPVMVVACGVLAYLTNARLLAAGLQQARLLPGLALMLAVAGPWYGYELVRHPEFWRIFFVGEHLGHLQGELARTEPVWGNLKYVLLFFFPWSLLLPAALVHAFRQPDRREPLRLMAWCSLAVVALFSLPQSKLSHYLAPAFPPMALLVGAWLDQWIARRPVSRVWAALGFGSLALVGLVCGAGAVMGAIMPPALEARLQAQFGGWRPGWSPVVMLAVLSAGSLGAVAAARWRRALVPALLAGAMLVAGLAHVGWFLPRRAAIQAQPRKDLALLLAAELPRTEPVGVYYAKRNASIFYLRRPIVDLGEREHEFDGLVRFLSSPTPRTVITHANLLPRLAAAVPGAQVRARRDAFVAVSNQASLAR